MAAEATASPIKLRLIEIGLNLVFSLMVSRPWTRFFSPGFNGACFLPCLLAQAFR